METGGIKRLILQENMLSVGNEIKGEWYYFNQTGILLQNQWKKWNNRWFYLTNSGVAAKN